MNLVARPIASAARAAAPRFRNSAWVSDELLAATYTRFTTCLRSKTKSGCGCRRHGSTAIAYSYPQGRSEIKPDSQASEPLQSHASSAAEPKADEGNSPEAGSSLDALLELLYRQPTLQASTVVEGNNVENDTQSTQLSPPLSDVLTHVIHLATKSSPQFATPTLEKYQDTTLQDVLLANSEHLSQSAIIHLTREIASEQMLEHFGRVRRANMLDLWLATIKNCGQFGPDTIATALTEAAGSVAAHELFEFFSSAPYVLYCAAILRLWPGPKIEYAQAPIRRDRSLDRPRERFKTAFAAYDGTAKIETGEARVKADERGTGADSTKVQANPLDSFRILQSIPELYAPADWTHLQPFIDLVMVQLRDSQDISQTMTNIFELLLQQDRPIDWHFLYLFFSDSLDVAMPNLIARRFAGVYLESDPRRVMRVFRMPEHHPACLDTPLYMKSIPNLLETFIARDEIRPINITGLVYRELTRNLHGDEDKVNAFIPYVGDLAMRFACEKRLGAWRSRLKQVRALTDILESLNLPKPPQVARAAVLCTLLLPGVMDERVVQPSPGDIAYTVRQCVEATGERPYLALRLLRYYNRELRKRRTEEQLSQEYGSEWKSVVNVPVGFRVLGDLQISF